MAFMLAYRIIAVPLGVGFPLLTVLMEGIGLRRNDPVALRLTCGQVGRPFTMGAVRPVFAFHRRRRWATRSVG
jgi:cytochrome bd-type quinol oxidase subunit 1